MVEQVGARLLGAFIFLAVVGGSTWAAYDHLGVADLTFRSATAAGLVTGARVVPGNSIALPFTFTNDGEEAEALTFGITPRTLDADVWMPERTVAPGVTTGGFVVVGVPADAKGATTLTLSIQNEGGASLGAVTFVIDAGPLPGPASTLEDTVLADYIGMFDDGSIFDTSIEAVATSAIQKAPSFREHPYAPLPVTFGERARTVDGFWRGVVGIREGETRFLAIAPEDGYGPATQQETIPATSTLERRADIVGVFQGARATYQTLLEEDTKEGDVVFFEDPYNRWPLLVEKLNETFARLVLDVEAGDAFTLYPFWPEASVVEKVGEQTVTFRTDPADEPERFTWFQADGQRVFFTWTNMTRLESFDEDDIVLRHDPPVGYEYEQQVSRVDTRTQTVVAVDDEVITVEYANPHPLAGRTLYFSVKAVAFE